MPVGGEGSAAGLALGRQAGHARPAVPSGSVGSAGVRSAADEAALVRPRLVQSSSQGDPLPDHAAMPRAATGASTLVTIARIAIQLTVRRRRREVMMPGIITP